MNDSILPNDVDIVCGQDYKKYRNRFGNQRFREVIRHRRDEYNREASRANRIEISKQIIEGLRPSRFIKRGSENKWVLLTNAEIREKLSHALSYSKRQLALHKSEAIKVRRGSRKSQPPSSLSSVSPPLMNQEPMDNTFAHVDREMIERGTEKTIQECFDDHIPYDAPIPYSTWRLPAFAMNNQVHAQSSSILKASTLQQETTDEKLVTSTLVHSSSQEQDISYVFTQNDDCSERNPPATLERSVSPIQYGVYHHQVAASVQVQSLSDQGSHEFSVVASFEDISSPLDIPVNSCLSATSVPCIVQDLYNPIHLNDQQSDMAKVDDTGCNSVSAIQKVSLLERSECPHFDDIYSMEAALDYDHESARAFLLDFVPDTLASEDLFNEATKPIGSNDTGKDDNIHIHSFIGFQQKLSLKRSSSCDFDGCLSRRDDEIESFLALLVESVPDMLAFAHDCKEVDW